jgi:hypothetical protein
MMNRIFISGILMSSSQVTDKQPHLKPNLINVELSWLIDSSKQNHTINLTKVNGLRLFVTYISPHWM